MAGRSKKSRRFGNYQGKKYSLKYELMEKCYLLLFYFSLTLFFSSGSDWCAIMGVAKTCISDVDWVCSKGSCL